MNVFLQGVFERRALGGLEGRRRGSSSRGLIVRRYSQWLENSAQVEVDAPIEVAWNLWEDRERIPTWMPWITSVIIQEDDPQMSKWTLSTFQFNTQWEFSWLARNMTPLKYQKIHWRSVPGSSGGSLGPIEIQNQGQIRFLKKSEGTCAVKLTISYEVPNALAPFANVRVLLILFFFMKNSTMSKDMTTVAWMTIYACFVCVAIDTRC